VAVLAALAGAQDRAALAAVLGELALDEAALVRVGGGHGAHLERFRIALRITAHVRHRAKYRDVPLPLERAFVFTRGHERVGAPARTLREFVEEISRAPGSAVAAHADRGDFSRWIADVFGDRSLALDIAELEEQHRRGSVLDLGTALVESVILRYEVAPAAEPARGD
jgi:hypothetical protein